MQVRSRVFRSLVGMLCVALVVAFAGPGVPAARAQVSPTTVNVELILDASGSMEQRIGGETRMQIAKRVLKDVIAAIPEREGINVGFRIYGHRGDNTASGKAVSCRSSELRVPIDGVDRVAIDRQVDLARSTGWTPLAHSLTQAGRDFEAATPGVVNAVVLLTDGLETCGGDPCAASAAINGGTARVTTHVVGFALKQEEEQILQCIADNGQGLLLGAQDADELSDALFTILEELDVVSTTGFLEIEAFGDEWPDATATCGGDASDTEPQGTLTTVRLDRVNRVEVPVGTCDVVWRNPSGQESGVSVDIQADGVTWIRGSIIEFPQGAGETYLVTDPAGVVVWQDQFETYDRVWVLPALYRIELLELVGDPILISAEIQTLPGSVTNVRTRRTLNPSPRPAPTATPRPRPTATPRPAPTATPRPTPGSARVPDLVGSPREDAISQLGRLGLRNSVTFRTTDDAAPGVVLSQTPRAGTSVPLRSTVALVVAQAPEAVTVPDISGSTEPEARALLESAGLVPGRRSNRTSDTVPSGEVISSEPRAGTRVIRGTSVAYVISRGPAPTATPAPTASPNVAAVPDVAGLSEPDAVADLIEAGFRPGVRSLRASDRVPAGDVIRTSPAAGTIVVTGTTIDYVVSSGPRPSPVPRLAESPVPSPTAEPTAADTVVPDLRGLSVTDAEDALRQAGLRLGEQDIRSNRQVPAGLVVRSTPAAGTTVVRGTVVDVVVSRGPRPTTQPTEAPPAESTPPDGTPIASEPPGTEVPSVSLSPAPGGQLASIQAAGVLRVNIDPDDPPWSALDDAGTASGFDIRVATRLARLLGVEVEFTSFPAEEVVTGLWAGRWDIALGHLVVTEARSRVLDFSQAYAWDPVSLAVSEASGVAVDDLAGRSVCVASLSLAEMWATGAVDLLGPTGDAAPPPDGATLLAKANDQECLEALIAGDVDGWAASHLDVMDAIADGAPIVTGDLPVVLAPVAVALDPEASADGSLLAAVDALIADMRADGRLARFSEDEFGVDLSQPPDGAPPAPTLASGDPPSVGDADLLASVPDDIAGRPVRSFALTSEDLVELLVPLGPNRTEGVAAFAQSILDRGSSLADVTMVIGVVVDAQQRSGRLTLARLPGVAAADLVDGLADLLVGPRSEPVAVTVAGVALDRYGGDVPADGPATHLAERGDVVVAISARPPLLGRLVRALLRP